MPSAAPLRLIRHAPALHGGALAGRRDVAADLSDRSALDALRGRLGTVTRIICSPALRCVQTAGALFPDHDIACDARLWEQDFGTWEGLAFDALPDLGDLGRDALARHRPPQGESFADLYGRVTPALHEIAQGGDAVIIAHAGVIRAALGLALDTLPGALAFEIAPLSLSELRYLPGHGWSISRVNEQAG